MARRESSRLSQEEIRESAKAYYMSKARYSPSTTTPSSIKITPTRPKPQLGMWGQNKPAAVAPLTTAKLPAPFQKKRSSHFGNFGMDFGPKIAAGSGLGGGNYSYKTTGTTNFGKYNSALSGRPDWTAK